MSANSKSSSTYELLNVVFSGLALCVSVFGLIYVVRSLESVERQLENSAFQTINEQMLEQDKIFIENPEIRPYFYDGVSFSDEDRKNTKLVNQVKAVADSRLDFYDLLWTQSDYIEELRVGGPGWQAWACFMRHSFDRSPALRERLVEVERWYTTDFIEAMKDVKCEENSRPAAR